MRNLTRIIIAIFCLCVLLPQAQAASKAKSKATQSGKERLVLMPLRLDEADQKLQGAMETALVEGLQRQYEVLSGEQVARKAREIFQKESRNTTKKECDETRCLQGITEAFQSELLAIASVTKQDGGYFLALSIRNLYDNIDVYSKSLPCEGCNAFQAVNKIKELVGVPAPVAEPLLPKITATDPDSITWAEAQKGNTADDYQVYLDAYPKGKYIAFAKAKLKKLKEAEQALAEQQEQQAWDAAQTENSEIGYSLYLKDYPSGRFAGFARTRINKLRKDAAEIVAHGPQPGQSFKDCADCPEIVMIPAGSFDMGSNNGDADEKSMHRVTIGKAFAIGKTEITRGQFAVFVNATGYDAGNECYVLVDRKWGKRTGNNWRNPGFQQDDSHPVACINWNDASAYVEWLSRKTGKQYRLPTEAQWEYACRAGRQDEYCGSDNLDSVAWFGRNAGDATQPSARKQANAFGLYDMSGNVWEWVADSYHDSYNGAPGDGSEWQGNGTWRTLRGGSWSGLPSFTRSANRGNNGPVFRDANFGFRVSRTLP